MFAFTVVKCANMTNEIWKSKNVECYSDFESIGKVAKKLMLKNLSSNFAFYDTQIKFLGTIFLLIVALFANFRIPFYIYL